MKKRLCLTFALLFALAAGAVLPRRGAAGVSAADASAYSEISYTFYDYGDGCAIEYYMSLGSRSLGRLAAAGVNSRNFLTDIKDFMYEYQHAAFDMSNSGAKLEIDCDAAEFYAVLDFPNTASYYRYLRAAPGDGASPASKGFFRDEYRYELNSFFRTEESTGSPFDSNDFLFMLDYLLTGANLDFAGLLNAYPALFSSYLDENGWVVLSLAFADFRLAEWYAVSTRYFTTNADNVSRENGWYYHVWNMSYASASASLDPNRVMRFKIFDLKPAGYYAVVFIITAAFIGAMILFTVVLPRRRAKKAAGGNSGGVASDGYAR